MGEHSDDAVLRMLEALRLAPLAASLPPPSPLTPIIRRVVLGDEQTERIKSAQRRLDAIIRNDESLRPLTPRIFLQGSVATRTALRPSAGLEFDADLVLLMDIRSKTLTLEQMTDARFVGGFIQERLSTRKFYADRLERRRRCLRVSYANDFHLDIVIAHANVAGRGGGSPLLIADLTSGKWTPSHPLGFIQWFEQKDSISEGRLRSSIIVLKHWLRERDIRIPSMLLTTIATYCAPQRHVRRDDQYFTAICQGILGKVAEMAVVPEVPNPTLESENLARDWTKSEFDAFRDAIRHLATETGSLCDLRGPQARKRWQEILVA